MNKVVNQRVILATIIMMVVIYILPGCAKVISAETAINVKTVKSKEVTSSKLTSTSEYLGIVKAKEEVLISSKEGGKVLEVNVQKGDYVSQGDVVARMDVSDFESQLNATRERYLAAMTELSKLLESFDFIECEYDRARELYLAGAISESDFSKVELNLNQMNRTISAARMNLNAQSLEIEKLERVVLNGTLIASCNGVVESVYYSATEHAPPSQPIIKLNSEHLILRIAVSGEDLASIKLNQSVEIGIESSNQFGKVTYISDQASYPSQVYEVEVEIDSSYNINDLLPCRFTTEVKQGIWIPISSIQTSSVDYVYLIEDGKAIKRIIHINEILGDNVMVEGIETGEMLIVSGMKTLLDGIPVKESER